MAKAQNPKESKQSILSLIAKPFIIASLSGCIATSVIQPIDTVKVNIQSLREAAGRTKVDLSPLKVAKDIVNRNGVAGTSKNS
jgi:solute carrier family 25 oxoglutarate transporter 11